MRNQRGRQGSSPSLLIGTLAFLATASTAVASLGTPLLPMVEQIYSVPLAASQWALTVTLLVGAVATPLMGRLGDGRRRRQTILASVAVMMAGCVLSALPTGFVGFLIGRAFQGVGLGLVPLATAVARDAVGAGRSRPTIALIGITTAAGVGVGYPLVGLLAQYAGLSAPFWVVTALSALTLVAAVTILPESPDRPPQIDASGATLLGLGIAGLLLVLAQGQTWGWGSEKTIGMAAGSGVLLAAWMGWELRTSSPLIELRLVRRGPVLAANVTAFFVSIGFYPLLSLVVRFVQTPAAVGYGFGAPVVVAGLMLTPFSLASFAASKIALPAARRTSMESVVAASCIALVASALWFLFARDSYWDIVGSMALSGLGVGCVFAVNPLQIADRVPADETGSAISFYQLVRTVAYSFGSALSATVLVLYIPPGGWFPTEAGYTAGAAMCTGLLVIALAVSASFAVLHSRTP
jgi:predicted MFS family arabinose efflux permease